MNYSEITDLVLTYSDSQDPELIARLPSFYKVVESRLNRALSTEKQVTTVEIPYVVNVMEYSLPIDFLNLTSLEHASKALTPQSRSPFTYVPYKENTLLTFESVINGEAYSITGKKLYFSFIPDQNIVNNFVIRLSYAQRLPPLTTVDTTNWVSDLNPDCYIFGLLVEVNAFKKDKDATSLWDARFLGAIEEIEFQNTEYLWNGPTLVTRVA